MVMVAVRGLISCISFNFKKEKKEKKKEVEAFFGRLIPLNKGYV